jgi:hypothetical protein
MRHGYARSGVPPSCARGELRTMEVACLGRPTNAGHARRTMVRHPCTAAVHGGRAMATTVPRGKSDWSGVWRDAHRAGPSRGSATALRIMLKHLEKCGKRVRRDLSHKGTDGRTAC